MYRRSLLLHALFVAMLLLVGCDKYSVRVLREPQSTWPSFDWIDARSLEQRESGHESLFIVNCAYGIYRIGDDNFSSDRAALLRSDLAAALGRELQGKTVTLRNYVVHFNRAREFRESVAGSSTGLIPALMNDISVHGCSNDDLQGGYSSDELTNDESPIVVVIDVEVNCKAVRSRWVASPTEVVHSFSRNNQVWNEWVSGAIDGATRKLVSNLRAELSTSTLECATSSRTRSGER